MKPLIAIDPGHGLNTRGKRTPLFADGSFMKEREFNKSVANYLQESLEKNGFYVLNVAESDIDVPLVTRTAVANNSSIKNKFNRPADFYISIHANASGDGASFNSANGIDTFIYKNITSGSKTEKWAEIVQRSLISKTKRTDRGVKRADFHVLRETTMPSVLVECGFMTNKYEAELLRSNNYRITVAQALSKAVCDIFSVNKDSKNGTPIIGKATATVLQAKAWAKSKKATDAFILLADIFWELSEAASVNPVVVYCQSAKETGFGKFGNDVRSGQNNFSGIGATGKGTCGNSFSTPRQGIQAQVDHIALYAGGIGYPRKSTPDPRHLSYLKGTARTVEELSGKWAADEKYGEGIVEMMDELQNTISRELQLTTSAELSNIPDWQKIAFKKLVENKIIKTPEYWEERLGETITVGEIFAVIANI